MKRRAGGKPTAYDALQFKTLYLDLVGGGEASAPVLITPDTPTELDATTVSSASIYLEWSSTGENTTNYLIESSTDGVAYTQIAIVPVGVTVYTDTGLTASTLYYYRVRAASASNYSPYSNVASATTLAVVLDDFDRADEGPPPSASWTYPGAFDGLKVVSNECAPDGVLSGASTWDTSFGADQVVYATIPAIPLNWAVTLFARHPDSAEIFAKGSYFVYAVAGFIQLFVYHTDMSLHLLGTAAMVWSAGDRVKLRCKGTTIKAYADVGAGWVEKLSVTDSSLTSGGYIGAYLAGNANTRIDDFGGGTI